MQTHGALRQREWSEPSVEDASTHKSAVAHAGKVLCAS